MGPSTRVFGIACRLWTRTRNSSQRQLRLVLTHSKLKWSMLHPKPKVTRANLFKVSRHLHWAQFPPILRCLRLWFAIDFVGFPSAISARFGGDCTASAVDNRFRRIKRDAQLINDSVKKGIDPITLPIGDTDGGAAVRNVKRAPGQTRVLLVFLSTCAFPSVSRLQPACISEEVLYWRMVQRWLDALDLMLLALPSTACLNVKSAQLSRALLRSWIEVEIRKSSPWWKHSGQLERELLVDVLNFCLSQKTRFPHIWDFGEQFLKSRFFIVDLSLGCRSL